MQPQVKETTMQARLYALLETLLKDSDFVPGAYHPIILNLAKGHLKKASEDDLRKQIEQVRDEIIPFILGE